jgi:hypothetical protein
MAEKHRQTSPDASCTTPEDRMSLPRPVRPARLYRLRHTRARCTSSRSGAVRRDFDLAARSAERAPARADLERRAAVGARRLDAALHRSGAAAALRFGGRRRGGTGAGVRTRAARDRHAVAPDRPTQARRSSTGRIPCPSGRGRPSPLRSIARRLERCSRLRCTGWRPNRSRIELVAIPQDSPRPLCVPSVGLLRGRGSNS